MECRRLLRRVTSLRAALSPACAVYRPIGGGKTPMEARSAAIVNEVIG